MGHLPQAHGSPCPGLTAPANPTKKAGSGIPEPKQRNAMSAPEQPRSVRPPSWTLRWKRRSAPPRAARCRSAPFWFVTASVLARDGNRTLELNDPTAHAEIQVIRTACAETGSQRLPGCDLYVTLEPCPMCAGAISFAGSGGSTTAPATRRAVPSTTARASSASRPATTPGGLCRDRRTRARQKC